jgi:hypothetical protein
MFLILEFAACFIAVCFTVMAILATCGLCFAITVAARKSANALHSYYRTHLQSRELAKVSVDATLPIPLLADCAL